MQHQGILYKGPQVVFKKFMATLAVTGMTSKDTSCVCVFWQNSNIWHPGSRLHYFFYCITACLFAIWLIHITLPTNPPLSQVSCLRLLGWGKSGSLWLDWCPHELKQCKISSIKSTDGWMDGFYQHTVSPVKKVQKSIITLSHVILL